MIVSAQQPAKGDLCQVTITFAEADIVIRATYHERVRAEAFVKLAKSFRVYAHDRKGSCKLYMRYLHKMARLGASISLRFRWRNFRRWDPIAVNNLLVIRLHMHLNPHGKKCTCWEHGEPTHELAS